MKRLRKHIAMVMAMVLAISTLQVGGLAAEDTSGYHGFKDGYYYTRKSFVEETLVGYGYVAKEPAELAPAAPEIQEGPVVDSDGRSIPDTENIPTEDAYSEDSIVLGTTANTVYSSAPEGKSGNVEPEQVPMYETVLHASKRGLRRQIVSRIDTSGATKKPEGVSPPVSLPMVW